MVKEYAAVKAVGETINTKTNNNQIRTQVASRNKGRKTNPVALN
jgi:hypothetical protein